jgi:hypothetical protein
VYPEWDLATPLDQSGLPAINYTKPTEGNEHWWAVHGTPKQAVEWGWLTPDQLEEYTLYAFWREPSKRLESIFRHVCGGSRFDEHFDLFVSKMDKGTLKVLGRQQVEYDPCTYLDFGTYVDSLNTVVTALGAEPLKVVPRLNYRPEFHQGDKVIWSEATKVKARELFPDDYKRQEQKND